MLWYRLHASLTLTLKPTWNPMQLPLSIIWTVALIGLPFVDMNCCGSTVWGLGFGVEEAYSRDLCQLAKSGD